MDITHSTFHHVTEFAVCTYANPELSQYRRNPTLLNQLKLDALLKLTLATNSDANDDTIYSQWRVAE